jgi:hypothetical protein
MDGWLGWTAEEWSALGALIAAGGAAGTLVVAIVAALAAFRQVREARALRQEQAQPYVAVYMEPSAATLQIIDLVVRNFGATAAHEVRLRITPRPQRSVQGGGVEDVWLPDVLPTLVPGQEWRTMWDLGRDRKDSGLPDQHRVEVVFSDSHGRALSATYQLDWGAYKGRQWVVATSGTATRRIAEIARNARHGCGSRPRRPLMPLQHPNANRRSTKTTARSVPVPHDRTAN